jgi:hypothetical protein
MPLEWSQPVFAALFARFAPVGSAGQHFSAETFFIAELFHSYGVKKFRAKKIFRAHGAVGS